MKTDEVLSVLCKSRYGERAWACLREVGDATGFSCKRHVDLVAIGLWPSRGMEIHGVEAKVTRGDWKKELKDPEKAEQGFRRFCDRWYVAAPAGIVPIAELPPTWGLLEVSASKVTLVKESDLLVPEPMGRAQIAAIARRLVEQTAPEAVLAAARAEGCAEAAKLAEEAARLKFKGIDEDLKELRQRVVAFQKASGVDIAARWDAGRIGQVVHDVLLGKAQRSLDWAREELKMLRNRIDTAIQVEELSKEQKP